MFGAKTLQNIDGTNENDEVMKTNVVERPEVLHQIEFFFSIFFLHFAAIRLLSSVKKKRFCIVHGLKAAVFKTVLGGHSVLLLLCRKLRPNPNCPSCAAVFVILHFSLVLLLHEGKSSGRCMPLINH